MDDVPPAAQHVLRPHHVVLLSVLMIAFKDHEINKLPPAFALHIHRILLNEVAEVIDPKPHAELMNAISMGPQSDAKECGQFMAAIKTHGDIYSPEKLGNFLGNLPSLFMDDVRFSRKSIFGHFCRRCFVTFIKLSYAGLSKLREDYQAWCAGENSVAYDPAPQVDLTINYLIHKTQSDKKTWASPFSYEQWERGKAIGDENVAIESIRRFFEQHFHDHTDSGFRQHALLNVVHMHYINKEYVAARKLLGEAISVARTANDRLTLQHCLSMLHRLPPPPGVKPTINEIQPDMHPLEVLYDVKKLMDEENEQPLSAAFTKIVQAMGLYDHWLDVQPAAPNEEHQWAQHAVQSVVWQEAGCDNLATISEDIVIAFTDIGGDNSCRLTVLTNRAYRTARRGRYNEALSILLEPKTWRGLTMADYNVWANEVWNILAMRTVRRGQGRLYKEYLLPRRPQGNHNPRYYQFEQESASPLPSIRQSLYQVLQLKEHDQLATSVDDLLKLLWQSEFLGRYHVYRTGVILMADFGLEYGMPHQSKRILEEILPQIITGNDLEQRAVGCFTYARCLLAADAPDREALQRAIEYVQIAEADFRQLEMYGALKDIYYLLTVLHENLGHSTERDVAVESHEKVTVQCQELAGVDFDKELSEVLHVVVLAGVGLTDR
ncbi:hypothetical protein FA15DRAFT_187068 [Coprinopsis marcescibilis]|uniref:Anaphase-promoting complex subunit 5 n=1 Tax=Coprinopsis marcescibilis TaxID=230819 RepID=A0A5C3LAW0_COPMA|nr:hypothetical protein FA15DRAFT_187068 [Coprinopsis marcescibilis]